MTEMIPHIDLDQCSRITTAQRQFTTMITLPKQDLKIVLDGAHVLLHEAPRRMVHRMARSHHYSIDRACAD